MENGRIVEQGHYYELIAANGSFSRFAQEYGVTTAADAKKEVKGAEAAEPGTERKTTSAGKPLMQKEEQASGTISFKVWAAYARAARGWITVPLVLGTLVAMGAATGVFLSLSSLARSLPYFSPSFIP